MVAKRKSLGRGLSALLGEDNENQAAAITAQGMRTVAVEQLRPGRYQPRRVMDEAGIEELAQSIRDKGVLQPILVRRLNDGPQAYEIVAGERRWRAAQLAQVHAVPVIIKDIDDAEAMEIALVENLQRQDLNPLEEAEGYKRLMNEFSHTQEALSQAVGKSRSHVANAMRLLALPDVIKALLDDRSLSAGHARAILGAENPIKLAKQVVRRGLSVRETEKLAQASKQDNQAAFRRPAPAKDADTVALERDLGNILGLKVEIRHRDGAGSLAVHYDRLEQLDDVLDRLTTGGGDGALRLADPDSAGLALRHS